MSNMRLTMRKIKEVLRLKYEHNRSNRDIAKGAGISAGTVSSYINRAKRVGLTWPLPNDLDEDALHARLFPPKPSAEIERPKPDVVQIHQELKRQKGVTLQLLWYEYRERYPNGYGYSQFCLCYRDFIKTLSPTMRFIHHAGKSLFVDYAGVTLPWTDQRTGKIAQADIFVAVLGASNYTFVEATESQSLRDWIGSHQRAFEFIGGVTESVVPDNLKSGISQSHIYDPDINPTYQDMAIHYGVAILPARAKKPRDKAKAEVGVQGIERWILAPLRHQQFFNIDEINMAIKPLLKAYNEKDFQKLPGSRLSQFNALDKPALKPLPKERYEFAIWKKVSVGIDYHVAYEKHYYSVRHQYLKKKVEIRVSSSTIECIYKEKRIALHKRSWKPGHTTLKEHMPQSHREYSEWNPERLRNWAKSFGRNTVLLIEQNIKSRPFPQQAYRACLGILRLGKRCGAERLENAAKRALSVGAIRYKNIDSILKHGLDRQPLPGESQQSSVTRSSHKNIRGTDYYH